MPKRPSDKNLTPSQEAERQTWQYRAVAATRGNQTLLGTLLLAVMGKEPKGAPKWGHTAIIKLDGRVVADFQNRRGACYANVEVGTIPEIGSWFNRLADEIKATDEERMAMFGELRKWMAIDERALSQTPRLH